MTYLEFFFTNFWHWLGLFLLVCVVAAIFERGRKS